MSGVPSRTPNPCWVEIDNHISYCEERQILSQVRKTFKICNLTSDTWVGRECKSFRAGTRHNYPMAQSLNSSGAKIKKISLNPKVTSSEPLWNRLEYSSQNRTYPENNQLHLQCNNLQESSWVHCGFRFSAKLLIPSWPSAMLTFRTIISVPNLHIKELFN